MTAQPLAARRALITGAGSGIGRAAAITLASQGAAIALVDRDASAISRVEGEVARSGGRAMAVVADVRDPSQVSQAVSFAESSLGGLDTIIGAAGIELGPAGDDRIDRLSVEAWRETIDVNLTGMFVTCKYGVQALLRNGGGSVTIVGSPTAIRGGATCQHAYSASKAGCHGLVRVMAVDLASLGIRVNGVIPGFTDTPLTRFVTDEPDSLAATVSRIPAGRAARPEEIAAVIAWLSSDAASYATGAFFTVDGGMTAT